MRAIVFVFDEPKDLSNIKLRVRGGETARALVADKRFQFEFMVS